MPQDPASRIATPGAIPGDPRYDALLRKRFNKRFAGRPESFQVPGSANDVIEAVERAVSRGARITVQSGGHGLDGLVSDPAVRVVLDTSLLSSIHHDAAMGAFSVGAGATLGEAFRKLFLGWGALLPAGQSPDIGVGGHVLGGGFGFFHRQHGLAVDHLHGVEVVVVDDSGKARLVTATRDPSDPNHELWWAHTGCGGGNFGVVTRYFFRTPGASGTDPALFLPRAPAEVTTFKVEWSWKDLDESAFTALLRNFGAWCEDNAGADAPSAQLFSVLLAGRPPHGNVSVRGVVTAGDGSPALIDQHLAALHRDAPPPAAREVKRLQWLDFVLNPFPDLFAIGPGGASAAPVRLKAKDASLRRRHTDRQLAVAYDFLTRLDPEVAGGALGLASLGGRMSTADPGATAFAQRRAVLTTSYSAGWMDAKDDLVALEWVRAFYRDIFADAGGVPAPGEAYDGTLINHADLDLADPILNTSGVPWYTLYYHDNYRRLQRAKRHWDPRNVFHHALSISAEE